MTAVTGIRQSLFMRAKSLNVTLNREDYLLVIWEFIESFDKVSEKELATRLGISPPTAHEYLIKLSEDGLVDKDGKKISFTYAGRNAALKLVRMHRISEVFAYRFLEISWEDTHAAVMELEHIFSGDRGEKLFKNLGYPDSCPHGNPTDPDIKIREVPLSIAPEGKYQIKRIVFEDRGLLRELASIDAIPGTQVQVIRGDDLRIENQNGELKVPYNITMSLRLYK